MTMNPPTTRAMPAAICRAWAGRQQRADGQQRYPQGQVEPAAGVILARADPSDPAPPADAVSSLYPTAAENGGIEPSDY